MLSNLSHCDFFTLVKITVKNRWKWQLNNIYNVFAEDGQEMNWIQIEENTYFFYSMYVVSGALPCYQKVQCFNRYCYLWANPAVNSWLKPLGLNWYPLPGLFTEEFLLEVTSNNSIICCYICTLPAMKILEGLFWNIIANFTQTLFRSSICIVEQFENTLL